MFPVEAKVGEQGTNSIDQSEKGLPMTLEKAHTLLTDSEVEYHVLQKRQRVPNLGSSREAAV